MTKLTSFRWTIPQNHLDDCVLANTLHHGLTGYQPAL